MRRPFPLGCLMLACLPGIPPSQTAAAEPEPAAPVATGTVVGTIDVRYQPPGGLLGKMGESTRSRKWQLFVGRADDTGVAYRVQEKFEVREGAPRPFVLVLPAGSYRFVDVTNELSGGMERQTLPLHASFDAVAGETRYAGRLRVAVVGKMMYALATKDVADCRDADLALVAGSDATAAAAVTTTALMRVEDESGPRAAGTCEPPLPTP